MSSSEEQLRLRRALGHFGTGVTIVTCADHSGRLYGVTASSFNSVSLDPPMVLWSQSRKAPSNAVFQSTRFFAINVLHAEQEAMALQFARPSDNKFQNVGFDLSEEGLPLLHDSAATFVCRNDQCIYGGDHSIFVATVLRHDCADDVQPLFFWRGQFVRPQHQKVAA